MDNTITKSIYSKFLLIVFFATVITCSGNRAEETVQKPIITVKPITSHEVSEIVGQFAGDKAVLINVWATWCIPCIEEFPYIVRVREEFKDDFEVIFISADFPEVTERVEAFLADHNVSWQTYLKNDRDEPFIDAVWTEWTGAIPATVVYTRSGEFMTAFERPATYEEFRELAIKAIQ
jgi:thiol-disulfide isomerase/thioredoxin